MMIFPTDQPRNPVMSGFAKSLETGWPRSGKLALVLCFTASSVAAQSPCPTGGDLAAGITIAYGSDRTDVFQTDPADRSRVFVDGWFKGEPASRTILINGLYQVRSASLNPDGSETFATDTTFSLPQSEMPLPAGGRFWEVAVTMSGIPEDGMMLKYSFGDGLTVDISGCRYEAIPVTVSDNLGGGEYDTYHYLTALGFGYYAADGYDDVTVETQVPVSIRALD